jgi:hypothetical protein
MNAQKCISYPKDDWRIGMQFVRGAKFNFFPPPQTIPHCKCNRFVNKTISGTMDSGVPSS